MGFWHTGYTEFHEASGLDDYVYTEPEPVRYACEHCSAQFETLETLRRHRFEQHPIRQPTLWLRGHVTDASMRLVVTQLAETDVAVEDATSCYLNGQAVEISQLGTRLSAMRHEYVEIDLSNDATTVRRCLDFRVADPSHLTSVESAFLRLANDHKLDIQAVSKFNDECRSFESAMPYCDGISNYLYGVMAKEQTPDTGLKHEKYIENFSRSFNDLLDFDRPIARSVRALISFHFNQFEDAERIAPEGSLKNAAGAFSGLLQGMPWHYEAAFSPKLGDTIQSLLTDKNTLLILANASCGLIELKSRVHELLNLSQESTMTNYDKLKCKLLAAEALVECENENLHLKAREIARELASLPDTNAWAAQVLERTSKS